MRVWTEERIEALKRLWGGGWSATQIAAEVGGVTRNGVIDKVHRLGLTRREARKATRPKTPWSSQIANECAAAQRTRKVLPFAPAPSVTQPKPADPVVERSVALTDLQHHHCRWPVAHGLFCGKARVEHPKRFIPYCADHCVLAYIPKQSRRAA